MKNCNKQIPVFVVSMINSDRRKKISQQLNEYNFLWLDAVNGREIKADIINEINNSYWVKAKYKRNLVCGEIGCSLSHRIIYNKMVENNISWAIVFEDDIVLDTDINIQNVISENIGKLDDNNIYILGAQEYIPESEFIVKSIFTKLIINDGFIFNKTIKSEKYIYRTAAYIISNSVAKKILKFTETRFCVADDWFNYKKFGLFENIYLSNIAKHPEISNEQSIIESERLISKKQFIKNNKIYIFLKKILKVNLKYFRLIIYSFKE